LVGITDDKSVENFVCSSCRVGQCQRTGFSGGFGGNFGNSNSRYNTLILASLPPL
jgi:hypothetical protein